MRRTLLLTILCSPLWGWLDAAKCRAAPKSLQNVQRCCPLPLPNWGAYNSECANSGTQPSVSAVFFLSISTPFDPWSFCSVAWLASSSQPQHCRAQRCASTRCVPCWNVHSPIRILSMPTKLILLAALSWCNRSTRNWRRSVARATLVIGMRSSTAFAPTRVSYVVAQHTPGSVTIRNASAHVPIWSSALGQHLRCSWRVHSSKKEFTSSVFIAYVVCKRSGNHFQHTTLALLEICRALALNSIPLGLVIASRQRLVAWTAWTEHYMHQATQHAVVLTKLCVVCLADKSQHAAIATA